MKHAFRTLLNSLIWLAALLSPFQALQGTPLLCNLAEGCVCAPQAGRSSHESGRAEPAVCECCHGADYAGDVAQSDVASAVPLAPSKCAQTCCCQSPTQPQSQPSEPTTFTAGFDLVCRVLAVDKVTAGSLSGIGNRVGRMGPAQSAQQVCASLCRFLA